MYSMKKIMILDDDPETLDLLTRILHKKYEVYTETDPAQLLKDSLDYQPDLILVDHLIGDITSKDIIGVFQKRDALRDIPVVIHSAHEQIEQIAASVHASGFIRKPASISEIRNYLENQLEDKDVNGTCDV